MFHIPGDVDYLKKQVEDLQRQLRAEKAERLKLSQTMVPALQARIEQLANEHATRHETLRKGNEEGHTQLSTRIEHLETQAKGVKKMLIDAVNHQLGEISQELTPILQPPAEPAPASTFWEKLCALFRV